METNLAKMKWSIIGGLLLCSSLFTGCIKEKCTNNLPECIKEIVNNPAKNNDLKTIRLQVQGTEHYYWLNTDATAFDGVEYIINNRCDTVCVISAVNVSIPIVWNNLKIKTGKSSGEDRFLYYSMIKNFIYEVNTFRRKVTSIGYGINIPSGNIKII